MPCWAAPDIWTQTILNRFELLTDGEETTGSCWRRRVDGSGGADLEERWSKNVINFPYELFNVHPSWGSSSLVTGSQAYTRDRISWFQLQRVSASIQFFLILPVLPSRLWYTQTDGFDHDINTVPGPLGSPTHRVSNNIWEQEMWKARSATSSDQTQTSPGG